LFASRGALSIRAIDKSEKLLGLAKWRGIDVGRDLSDKITYQLGNLDHLDQQAVLLPDTDAGTIDLVFSSLALSQVRSLSQLVARVYQILKPGGAFVFSVPHPIHTASSGRYQISTSRVIVDGDGHGNTQQQRVWPLWDYVVEGPRLSCCLPGLSGVNVPVYHRTMASYINMITMAGFELTEVEEWAPTKAVV
jgi:SAM-dependent methyltransferase